MKGKGLDESQLLQTLTSIMDKAKDEGRLADEAIQHAIDQFRAAHPYCKGKEHRAAP